MEIIIKYLPILVPYLVIVIGLAIFSLVHVLKHPHYRFGNKLMWALIVLLVQLVGPICYFAFGRGEE